MEYDQVTYLSMLWRPWACCSAKTGLRCTAGCPLLHHPKEVQTNYDSNRKKLAVCAAVLGVLVCGTALTAAAASPVSCCPERRCHAVDQGRARRKHFTGSYTANMLLGSSQQLSPVVRPSYSTDSVVFLTDDSSVLTVSSSGVVQAVGVGTATVTAAAGNQICAYTIVVSMDSSMIVTEMDLSLSSNTIYVGNSVSAPLQVRPSSASNYATVTLTSSNEKIATVNSFGRVTGVAPGKATITATCGSVVATTTVTVLALPTDSSTGTSGTPSNNSGQVITPRRPIHRAQARCHPHHYGQSHPCQCIPVLHLQVRQQQHCHGQPHGRGHGAPRLLHRYALGQIAGLIDVAAAQDGHLVGEQLQRHDELQGASARRRTRHADDQSATLIGPRPRPWW